MLALGLSLQKARQLPTFALLEALRRPHKKSGYTIGEQGGEEEGLELRKGRGPAFQTFPTNMTGM